MRNFAAFLPTLFLAVFVTTGQNKICYSFTLSFFPKISNYDNSLKIHIFGIFPCKCIVLNMKMATSTKQTVKIERQYAYYVHTSNNQGDVCSVLMFWTRFPEYTAKICFIL